MFTVQKIFGFTCFLSIHDFFTPSTVPHVSRIHYLNSMKCCVPPMLQRISSIPNDHGKKTHLLQKAMLTFDDLVALIYSVPIVKTTVLKEVFDSPLLIVDSLPFITQIIIVVCVLKGRVKTRQL